MAVTGFWAELVENSWNQAANTSSVTVRVYITTTSSYNRLGTAHGAISFGGNASGTISFSNTFDRHQTKCIYSRTWTVSHNADGSGSVSVSVWFDTRVSAGTINASASLTLHKIPRATTPTVSGALTLGQPVNISLPRATGSYTHTVRWSCAGQNGTVGTGLGTSATFTPQLSLANHITNATSAVCTLTTTTYNGASVIGETSMTFRLSVPASMVPTISAVSVTDANGYLAEYGAFISGKSSIVVSATAASVYGATIASYSVTMGELSGTGNPCTLGSPTVSSYDEQKTVSVTVTDTRGRTATSTQQVRVVLYTLPDVANETTVLRWDVAENEENDESETVRVNLQGSVFNVDGGGENTASIKIEHREFGADAWTTDTTVQAGAVFSTIYDIAGCDNTKRYEVRITITDAFEQSYSVVYSIATATPIMDFLANGRGLAFFGVSRFEGIHFNGDVTLTNADGTGASLLGFSGQEEPYYLLHTYPQAGQLTAPPNLRIGGTEDEETYETKRIGALELYWDKWLAGDMGALLWYGTWASGSVTMPNAHKYRAFLVRSGNTSGIYLGTTIAFKAGATDAQTNTVTGIGGVNDNGNSQIIYSLHVTTEYTSGTDERWTLQRNNYLNHNVSTGHSAGGTLPVFEVRGLF